MILGEVGMPSSIRLEKLVRRQRSEPRPDKAADTGRCLEHRIQDKQACRATLANLETHDRKGMTWMKVRKSSKLKGTGSGVYQDAENILEVG